VALLTTLDERLEVMRELGVDVVYIIRFTLEVSRLGAREFYEREVVGKVGVREVVVGHDHKFGHDRSAGQNELFALGRELGFGVRVMPPLEVEGAPVSSTRIRHALASGNAGPASILLGSPYTLAGVVVRGDGRGRQLGFPTANLQPDAAHKIIPAGGVYAVEVLAHGSTYGGMMNIGVRPTVTDGSKLTCEIHLFRFSGDLYGERLTVRFLERLREERRFPSVDRLLEQLELDREATRAVLAQRSIIHSAS
jgi:riboflavin kinase/FMN adenylyltransferase